MRLQQLRYFLGIVLIIILINNISADFEIGNASHSIDLSYNTGSDIRGWINISLQDESTNSTFGDSGGNSVSLIDLLKINKDSKGITYSCNVENCLSDYSSTNSEVEKTFSLEKGGSKLIGIKVEFETDLLSISSMDFDVESNAPSSCFNQVEIDFLLDGTIDKGNNKVSDETCPFLKTYGCFSENETLIDAEIGAIPYCQRIELTASPGFRLGAFVNNAQDLEIALHNTNNGNSIEGAYCALPNSTSQGEIFCDITYSVAEPKEYYVCVRSTTEEGDPEIKAYSSLNGCGFQGIPTGRNSENTAYQIFAEGKRFDAVGAIEISNFISEEYTVGDMFKDYLTDRYENCQGGCIIPLKFTAEQDQEITINNFLMEYNIVGISGIKETKFYDLEEIPSKVNADFQKIYLDEGNFTLPKTYENFTFKLDLNNEEIFSEEIIIGKIPSITALIPTSTASAYPTEFEVIASASSQIIKYDWEFGDGKKEQTSDNKITHTYNSTGTYSLKVTVTDFNQLNSSRTFEITIKSPEEIIEGMLDKKQSDLVYVKAQIEEFPQFEKESLNNILDIDLMDDKLKQNQLEYQRATSEEELNDILTDLLALEVPESVSLISSADSISFYPERENIDVEILKTIGGGDYGDNKEGYIDAIPYWMGKNADVKISLEEFSAKYEYFDRLILKTFDVEITEKERWETSPYLILRKLDDLTFKENYLDTEESGYVYIILDEAGSITFSATEDIGFVDLPLFISPKLERLEVSDSIKLVGEEDLTGRWTLFILVIILIAIFGFVAYMILQEWYKRRYENYLFKKRNDLYNIVSYIENARKKEVDEGVISSRLRKTGWNSEQVNYALKKYEGKRTGMLEIPLLSLIRKFRKKKIEETKKNKNPFLKNTREKRFFKKFI